MPQMAAEDKLLPPSFPPEPLGSRLKPHPLLLAFILGTDSTFCKFGLAICACQEELLDTSQEFKGSVHEFKQTPADDRKWWNLARAFFLRVGAGLDVAREGGGGLFHTHPNFGPGTGADGGIIGPV